MIHFTDREANAIMHSNRYADVGALCNAIADAAIAKLAERAGMPEVMAGLDGYPACRESDVREALAAMQAKVDSLQKVCDEIQEDRDGFHAQLGNAEGDVSILKVANNALRAQLEQAQADAARYRNALTTLRLTASLYSHREIIDAALKEKQQ